MTWMITRLPEVFKTTATEQLLFPFFPVLVLIIIGLAIERAIAFARISRRIRAAPWELTGDEKHHVEVHQAVCWVDCLLSRRLLWFPVIALFCIFRIGIGVFYGLYVMMDSSRLVGELALHDVADGLMMLAADWVFITLEFFLSLLFFLLFWMWKKKLLCHYYLELRRTGQGSG